VNGDNQPLHAHQSKTFFLTDKTFSPLSFPWYTRRPPLKPGVGVHRHALENVVVPSGKRVFPSENMCFPLCSSRVFPLVETPSSRAVRGISPLWRALCETAWGGTAEGLRAGLDPGREPAGGRPVGAGACLSPPGTRSFVSRTG
jgi:hypothetical protein